MAHGLRAGFNALSRLDECASTDSTPLVFEPSPVQRKSCRRRVPSRITKEPTSMSFVTARLASVSLAASLVAASLAGCASDVSPSESNDVGVTQQALGRVLRPAVEVHYIANPGGEMTELFLHSTRDYTATMVETPDATGACASATCTHEEAGSYTVIGNIKTNQLIMYPRTPAGTAVHSYQMTAATAPVTVLLVSATGTTELIRTP
jgi:hypothetical protein